MTEIAGRLKLIHERVRQAAERAGRKPEDISIVAVSKNVDINDITEAVHGGVSILGENRVQEARSKFAKLGNEIEGNKVSWHLVGHLQRNKVRHALKIFDLIHSLDSWKLACEIEKVSKRLDIVTECLLEINVTGKDTRIGVKPENALLLAKDISTLSRVKLRGVMSIAPLVEDPSQARPYFRMTKRWRRLLTGLFTPVSPSFHGYDNDFEVAIEEGQL